MDKKEKESILSELKDEFSKWKTEIGFKSSYEQIQEFFDIENFVLKEDHVPVKLGRAVAWKIVDVYSGWLNYFHGLIMPNTGYLVNMNESKMLDETMKKKVSSMMSEVLAITSLSSYIAVSKDKNAEKEFVDRAVDYWESKFKKEVSELMKKINEGWDKK